MERVLARWRPPTRLLTTKRRAASRSRTTPASPSGSPTCDPKNPDHENIRLRPRSVAVGGAPRVRRPAADPEGWPGVDRGVGGDRPPNPHGMDARRPD